MSRTPATDWYQDDRPELWDDDADACDLCGGDGVVGINVHVTFSLFSRGE